MTSKPKLFIYALGAGLLISLALLSHTLGQNKSLEEQNMLLLNLACSLDSADFKNMLDALDSTDDFKQLLGDHQEAVWAQYKDQLYFKCYDNTGKQE